MLAEEYCFLWIDWWPMCMTRTEWSGWMQAVGALLGLSVAIWVSGSGARLEKRSAVIQARAFARELIVGISGMLYSAKNNERGSLIISISLIKELIALNQSIQPGRMDKEAMSAFINLRLYAAAVLVAAEFYRDDPIPEKLIDFQRMMNYYHGLTKVNVELLHKKHNSVPAESFNVESTIANLYSVADAVREFVKKMPP